MEYYDNFVAAGGLTKQVYIDLGPGPWKKEGYFGIDCREFWEGENPEGNLKVNADLVYDLNKGIPFPSNSVDKIFASHFLEHVSNVYDLLFECNRVLKVGGELTVIVPLFELKSVDHVTCFYPDWFERNISLPGGVLKDKFLVGSKNVELVNLAEEHRAFWQMTVVLVRL